MTVGARSEKIEDSRYESRLYRVLVPSFSVWKLGIKKLVPEKGFRRSRYENSAVPENHTDFLGFKTRLAGNKTDFPGMTNWKYRSYENDDIFCIRTPFSMILGSLESQQQALQHYA